MSSEMIKGRIDVIYIILNSIFKELDMNIDEEAEVNDDVDRSLIPIIDKLKKVIP